jgi:hypothetical protein
MNVWYDVEPFDMENNECLIQYSHIHPKRILISGNAIYDIKMLFDLYDPSIITFDSIDIKIKSIKQIE